MFFTYPQDFKERKLASGTVQKLVWGERIMLAYTTFEPNCSGPTHSHPEEQTGMVLDGEIKFTIGNDTRLCKKGDAFAIPGNVEHSVANGDKLTIVVQAFSPPREDYK